MDETSNPIRSLSSEEIDATSGGAIPLAVWFVVGVAIGYAKARYEDKHK